MVSLIMPLLVSVSHLRKWERAHMLSLVVIIHHKLLVEQRVSRHLRIIQTGSELGLLRDRECIMELNQCKNQERTHHIQLLLILEAHSFRSHQMFLIRLARIGRKPYQVWIALQMQLSAMFKKDVIQLRKK